MQEIDGQLTTLGSSNADDRSSSPTPDVSLDTLNISQCLEVVQILLDDWNKARHQKLVKIARELTVRHMVVNDYDSDSSAYAQASDHLEQFSIRRFRYVEIIFIVDSIAY